MFLRQRTGHSNWWDVSVRRFQETVTGEKSKNTLHRQIHSMKNTIFMQKIKLKVTDKSSPYFAVLRLH
jgi:hypothetical protein